MRLFQLIYFCKTLYMFQTGFASIISSSKLHTQHQLFVRPILLPTASLARLAAGSSNGLKCVERLTEVNKSYCTIVHFRRITSIYQPTNAHIISHKTLLKHFKTLRHVSISSDHHQGALFLAKVILQYSQFNSYLQTRCCGSI